VSARSTLLLVVLCAGCGAPDTRHSSEQVSRASTTVGAVAMDDPIVIHGSKGWAPVLRPPVDEARERRIRELEALAAASQGKGSAPAAAARTTRTFPKSYRLCPYCGIAMTPDRGPLSHTSDGMLICATCTDEGVHDQATALAAFEEARGLVSSNLGLDLGPVQVPVKLVSKQELKAQAPDSGPGIEGLTTHRGRGLDAILILDGLPRRTMVQVLVHELFHVFQREASNEKVETSFREGAANFAAATVLRALHDEGRLALLERNPDPVYGEGYRRFERLAASLGQERAVELGLRATGFPEGF
jgi:Protein DA1